MKVTKKRMLGVAAIGAASVLGLSACAGGSTDDASSSSITVWSDAAYVDALTNISKAYTESTGIEVKIVDTSGKDDVRADFIQAVPTGKAPDIVMGAHDWIGELATNGVVAPLEAEAQLAAMLPVAAQASTWDGQAYMVPFAVESIAMLRNTDLVAEAPASFDDMVAAGKFVVQQGENGDPYHLYPFQTSFGAPVFGLDDAGAYDATDLQLGSAGGSEFAEWLSAQGAAGVLDASMSYDLAKEAFTTGQAAFWLTGPWSVAAVEEAGINFAVDVIPAPGSNDASPFAGVKAFFLNAKSENKVAANDFLLNFIASEDAQLQLFEANKILPANAAAAATAAENPIVKGFMSVGEQAVPMPAIPEMASVWQFWGVAEAGIIAGGDAAAIWEQLVTDVSGAIAG